MAVKKVRHSFHYLSQTWAYIWVCRKHGTLSNWPFRCKCLKDKPIYEYKEVKNEREN